MYACVQVSQLVEAISNLNTSEQLNQTNAIVETLATITATDEQSLYPQELSTTVNVISTINKLEFYVVLYVDVYALFDNKLTMCFLSM